ncbi:MAG: hypothetical protein PUB05_05545 [Firmicutes bacterium]|nr:hypothetical protein [Bacillota bacterium]
MADILVALIAFAGTMVGTFGGIVTSSKLTNYRIQQLEKKVDKHNNFAERIPIIEEKIKTANHRISDLEAFNHGLS